jgi:hypothetical protein
MSTDPPPRGDVFAQVVAEVLQNVSDGIGNFTARLQDVRVVSAQEDFAGPRGESIQPARKTYCQTLNRTRERHVGHSTESCTIFR